MLADIQRVAIVGAQAQIGAGRLGQDRLQGFRPAARPDGIVERNERSLLQGVSRAELAQLRPTIRPEVAKLAEEADVTATAQAIDTSPKPLRRPRDIERIVAEARARAASPPEPEPEVQVASAAAVAPRSEGKKKQKEEKKQQQQARPGGCRSGRVGVG